MSIKRYGLLLVGSDHEDTKYLNHTTRNFVTSSSLGTESPTIEQAFQLGDIDVKMQKNTASPCMFAPLREKSRCSR